MTEHYTKNTISATVWCKACWKFTAHRVDSGRVGPCLACVAKTPGSLEFDAPPATPAAAPEAVQQPALFDAPAPVEHVKEDTVLASLRSDRTAAAVAPMGSAEGCELSREFAQACTDGRFDYRGYGMDAGERVYDYSRRGAADVVFKMRASRWDGTVAMLEREASRLERWLA